MEWLRLFHADMLCHVQRRRGARLGLAGRRCRHFFRNGANRSFAGRRWAPPASHRFAMLDYAPPLTEAKKRPLIERGELNQENEARWAAQPFNPLALRLCAPDRLKSSWRETIFLLGGDV